MEPEVGYAPASLQVLPPRPKMESGAPFPDQEDRPWLTMSTSSGAVSA
jgi:hypothetical protein